MGTVEAYRSREVIALNHTKGIALFKDGETGKIVNWMDVLGQFYEEPIERPLACVVKDPVWGFHDVDIRKFEHATVQ